MLPQESAAEFVGIVDDTPNEGFFIQYDRLYWSISAPDRVAIGDPNSERVRTTPDGVSFLFQNSLDTGFLEAKFSGGDRVDFGCVEGESGWLVSVLHLKQDQGLSANGVHFVPSDPDGLLAGYVDGNGDSIDDDLNGNHVYGRYGADLGTSDGNTPPSFSLPYDGVIDSAAAVDSGDMAFWLVTFNQMQVRNVTEITGVELMGLRRNWAGLGEDRLEWLCGARFLQIKDDFGITGSGGYLDASSWATNVRNDILGPQIGARWCRDRAYFTLAIEGRFLLGINFQRTEQTGQVASNAVPGGQNQPVSLMPTAFYATQSDEEFAPVGELRVDTVYRINPWFGFRLGYTGFLAGGVSRASEKVIYELPHFGITRQASQTAVFSNGLTFGLELNR
jgi:hypothetical protein